jgi:hypothetical protein
MAKKMVSKMKNNTLRLTTFTATILALSTFIGCGKDSCVGFVCGVNVQSFEHEGVTFAEFSAILETGAVQFPAFNLPIRAPETDEEIGILWMGMNLTGDTELGFRMNMSTIEDHGLPIVLNPTLPNGSPIPVTGLHETTSISYALEQGIQIYASYGLNTAMLGVAVPIRQLDAQAGGICPFAFMPIFNFDKVRGSAGAYFGCSPGTSGVGVFVDLSPALQNPPELEDILASSTSVDQESSVEFVDMVPSTRAQERRVQRALYRFHESNKGKKVTLQ